jgi:hypothetical protein
VLYVWCCCCRLQVLAVVEMAELRTIVGACNVGHFAETDVYVSCNGG